MTVVDKDLGYIAFKRFVATVGGLELQAGIFQGEIATYAAVQEFGTDSAGSNNNVRIPARAWMAPTIDANKDKYATRIAATVQKQMLTRTPLEAQRNALIRAGLETRNDLIKAIVALKDPPNAPSTIEQKGSSSPLVDTGAMQMAITFEVFPAGEGGE